MSQPQPIPPRGRSPALLIVDDHPATLYARSRILRRAGYEVLGAATGSAALRIVQEQRPRLVILDIHLPDTTGFEICNRIKSNPETAIIPVLHMSATKVSVPDRVRGLEGGADGYLVEPVPPDVMVATVRALLRMRQAEEDARESRRAMAALIGNLPGAAYRVQPLGGQLVFVSGPAEQLTGFTTTELLARPAGWWDLIDPEDHAAVRRAAEELNSAPRPVELTYRILARDGSARWIWDRASPIAEGSPPAWEGFATDITERKQAQTERDHLLASEHSARAEAERASRLKDEFLATLSHELRTPLNAVLGWTHVLRAKPPTPEALEQGLAIIERNARVQAQLIGDLLDMNRIISGKMRLDVKRIDLASVIDAAIDTVRPAAVAKDVRIHSSLAPLDRSVRGDPARLQQVVWNLVSNAVKFTDRGGRVEIVLTRDGPQALLTISDTGKGIKPEFLSQVFERFRQADSSTAREQGGLGLGLAIVKQLVELHGGTVRAESAGRGRGATFTVSLPLPADIHPPEAPAEPDETPALAPDLPRPPCMAPDLSGLRVLVVDDEPEARELTGRLLEECGAVVALAASADEGAELARSHPFEVILSDIGLPTRDGYDFIRTIRREGVATPAAAVTAFAREEDRERCLRAGYQAHIPKPVEPAELLAIVGRLASRAACPAPSRAGEGVQTPPGAAQHPGCSD